MKYLYYCNSAYQLLNVINLNWQRKYNNFENICNYESDLIVLDTFKGAKEIVEKLINDNDNMFSNVDLVTRVKNKGIVHKLSTFFDIVFPKRYIKKSGVKNIKEIDNVYSYIVVPKVSKITYSFWLLNKKAKIQIYEEGMGTYYGGKHMCYEKSNHQELYKFLNKGNDFSSFEAVYVNNESLYLDNDLDKVRLIPRINVDCLNKLKLNFKELMYDDPKTDVFWLGQYVENEINDSIGKELIQYKDKVTYCPHPRIKLDVNNSLKIEYNKMWELQILNIEDINDRCLISPFSTATFTPKMLYDKEPYLILTIKVFNNDSEHYKTMEKIIDRFVKTYSNKEKIMIPKNIEEFHQCLVKYMNRNKI